LPGIVLSFSFYKNFLLKHFNQHSSGHHPCCL